MTTPTHRCPARGCTRDVRDDLLMCGSHWRMVPATAQARVYRAYDNGRGRDSAELLTAQAAAILAVNTQLDAGGARTS